MIKSNLHQDGSRSACVCRYKEESHRPRGVSGPVLSRRKAFHATWNDLLPGIEGPFRKHGEAFWGQHSTDGEEPCLTDDEAEAAFRAACYTPQDLLHFARRAALHLLERGDYSLVCEASLRAIAKESAGWELLESQFYEP